MNLFGLGPMELGIILVIILLLFGPKQIPKLSRMFGKAVKDVREGFDSANDEEKAAKTEALSDNDAVASSEPTKSESKSE
ncbi:MAG TPA: twin-arginine translocase TatA/TatE family subunit [Coriobacteriia bacterium]|nr:twin-arginine translocase TatA/TatE family subunit [Coriobacteriia bacterium]